MAFEQRLGNPPRLVDEDADIAAAADADDYVPDPRTLWAAEASRAMMVVLARRLGSDFARDVHNEIFARTVAYEESCAEDRRDGATLEVLLQATFWDEVFASPPQMAPLGR